MPYQIKRTVKLVTEQHVTADPPEAEGYPMRAWTINILLQNTDGDEMPASCYEKATYILHETFGKRQRQVFRQPPFKISEKGWGEFDMNISLTPIGSPKGGEQVIPHDLNFQSGERYESVHQVTFRNPKGPLLEALRESGPVGDEARSNGAPAAATPATGTKEKRPRKSQNRNVDMEKLAEALPQLGEEDLLQVVQMVHDNKSEETYTKNDVESEFRRYIGEVSRECDRLLTCQQTASSTSTSTPSRTSSSRCSGTLPPTASTWPPWPRSLVTCVVDRHLPVSE